MWPKKDKKFEREQIETWNHHKHLDKDSFKQGVGKLLVQQGHLEAPESCHVKLPGSHFFIIK